MLSLGSVLRVSHALSSSALTADCAASGAVPRLSGTVCSSPYSDMSPDKESDNCTITGLGDQRPEISYLLTAM